MRLTALRTARLRTGCARLLAGLMAGGLLTVLFAWRASDRLGGLAIGALIGALLTAGAARTTMPRGSLPELREDLRPVDARRWELRSLLAAALTVAITLLLGWAERNAAVPTGLLLGAAVADLVAVAIVAGWERRHGQTVLLAEDRKRRELYARA